MTTLFLPARQLMAFFICMTLVESSLALYCQDAKLQKTGTNLTAGQAQRMLANASFKENRNVPRQQKIQRVLKHMAHSHRGLPKISAEELAELIVDVADCTGHDFTIFAGLLRKESDYCLNAINTSSEKSTASGCGQITIWPIREIKNHFNLPGSAKPSDPDAKQAILSLLNSCYDNDQESIQKFLALMSKSPETVKTYLRSGEDYLTDLIVAAVYLKFHYGKTGCYYDPNTPAPCALSKYGEGSGYAGRVTKFANNVNLVCFDDESYVKDIEETSCELSSDPAACLLTTPSFEI